MEENNQYGDSKLSPRKHSLVYCVRRARKQNLPKHKTYNIKHLTLKTLKQKSIRAGGEQHVTIRNALYSMMIYNILMMIEGWP